MFDTSSLAQAIHYSIEHGVELNGAVDHGTAVRVVHEQLAADTGRVVHCEHVADALARLGYARYVHFVVAVTRSSSVGRGHPRRLDFRYVLLMLVRIAVSSVRRFAVVVVVVVVGGRRGREMAKNGRRCRAYSTCRRARRKRQRGRFVIGVV